MGNPEWMEVELFGTVLGRAAHIDAVEAGVIDWLSSLTRNEAFEKAQAEHVPCFPVHTPAEVANNEQYRARRFFVEQKHSAHGGGRMPGAAGNVKLAPGRNAVAGPELVQD